MVKQVHVVQLKSRLAQGEKIILLDVRNLDEYEEAHIPNSILIPLAELPARLAELEALKGEEIIIYCKAGVRSAMACKFLASQGFANLVNLSDGMLAW